MNACGPKLMKHASKSGSAEKIPLSHSHWNALSVRMRGIEEDCREIERWLNGVAGIYEESVNPRDEETKQRARAVLTEILSRISAVKDDLGLRKEQIETTKVVNAHVAHLWETVHESKSEYLKGYGAVPEELRNYIDARMDEVLSVVGNLTALLAAPKKPVRREG